MNDQMQKLIEHRGYFVQNKPTEYGLYRIGEAVRDILEHLTAEPEPVEAGGQGTCKQSLQVGELLPKERMEEISNEVAAKVHASGIGDWMDGDERPEDGTHDYEVFDKAVSWTIDQLQSVLGVKEWSTSGGGTETLDGDVRAEIYDLLKAAKRDDDSIEARERELAELKQAMENGGNRAFDKQAKIGQALDRELIEKLRAENASLRQQVEELTGKLRQIDEIFSNGDEDDGTVPVPECVVEQARNVMANYSFDIKRRQDLEAENTRLKSELAKYESKDGGYFPPNSLCMNNTPNG